MYTDNTGRFPVRSRSGNQYIMIVYHFDSNAITAAPFKYHANKHRLPAYGSIMRHLKDRNTLVDLKIVDNKASNYYKRIIKAKWGLRYQLVPSHIHCRNAAECAIHTFKEIFLSILSGIEKTSPKNLWYLLILETELTLNLLGQSILNPNILAWEYFLSPFDYNAIPIGPLVCPVMFYWKTSNCKSWDFRGKEGWSIGVALDNF